MFIIVDIEFSGVKNNVYRARLNKHHVEMIDFDQSDLTVNRYWKV